MGESGTTTSAEADGPEASKKDLPPLVEIDPAGDIVLDVTFETSISTLNKTRKAELAASRKAGTQPPDRSSLKSKVRVAYRLSSSRIYMRSLPSLRSKSTRQMSGTYPGFPSPMMTMQPKRLVVKMPWKIF
ncbi:hypothetical protein LB505_008747 [Fusarium chuoi]|nr:hypothetical protein LB505_008747 [Fusarium chuoi]